MAVQISGNDITVPRDGSFTRNVTIGGTLTYEDVTNIDSVGLVTARSGIEIGARPGVAASISVDGNMIVSGISTLGDHLKFDTTGKGIIFGADGGNNRPSIIGNYTSSSNNNMVFNVTGSERLRINTGGQVNIGAAFDQTTYPFSVQGSSNTTAIIKCSGNDTANFFFDANRGSANANISLLRGLWNGTSVADIRFLTGTDTSNKDDGQIAFYTATAGSPAERMRISASGQVNIATTGGNEKLNVSGAVRVIGSSVNFNDGSEGALVDYDTSNNIARFGHVNGASGSARAVTFLSGGTERARLDSSGRLLIGTTTEGFATYGDKFTIANSGHCGMTIRSGSSNYGTIYFSDGDDGSAAEVRGFVEYNHSTNLLSLGSDGTSRLRLDSGGKIELGATSGPSARLDPSSNGELYIEADPGSNYGSSNIRFRVDNVEVARMVAGTHRYFGLGRTASQSNARMDINNESDQDVLFLTQNTNNQTTRNLVMLHTGASGGFAPQIVFMDNQGGIRGTIKNNTSSTQYNTSSDYRLKENEVVISDGIERIKQLKPYRFNWKNRPDTIVDGFFAHEVQNIVEDCVEGTKDEVYTEDNDDLKIKAGDPKYQEMDHSKLVPLLTAALQEAVTEIESLKARLDAASL